MMAQTVSKPNKGDIKDTAPADAESRSMKIELTDWIEHAATVRHEQQFGSLFLFQELLHILVQVSSVVVRDDRGAIEVDCLCELMEELQDSAGIGGMRQPSEELAVPQSSDYSHVAPL